MMTDGLGWLTLALLVTWASPVVAQPASTVAFAAHRGGALLWPENSLLAFGNAVTLGADYLELDVHVSRDGALVVIHDPTLERTTTGTGPVRERTRAELKALRLKDRDGRVTGERIPTLEEVVAIAAAGRRQLLVEIKADDRRQRYPGIEEQVLAILDRHGMAASTIIMAFEAETWRRVRQLRPDVRAGALFSPRLLERQGSTLSAELDRAREAGVAFVGLHQALVGPDTVAAARKAGVLLGVWTVNERDAIRRFIAENVGVVITDRPDLAKELLERR